MKKYILSLVAFLCFNILNACDLNVDSLFNSYISKFKEKKFKVLKSRKNDSTLYTCIEDRDDQMFLSVTCFLSGLDFDPHSCYVSKNSILAIEEWYKRKKIFITCERVEKVYSLLIFKGNSIDDLLEWERQLNSLKID